MKKNIEKHCKLIRDEFVVLFLKTYSPFTITIIEQRADVVKGKTSLKCDTI